MTPAVNQLELHPYFPQEQMRPVDADLGIVTESWSPLGKRPTPFEEPPVADAAAAHGVTPGQVVLRWHLQLGAVPIPKSADPQRQRRQPRPLRLRAVRRRGRGDQRRSAGADGRRFGGDPDTHEEM